MRYLGGKSRLAKRITSAILGDTPRRGTYFEPMVGGGAVFQRIAPHFQTAVANDIHPDVSKMWQAVSRGWLPPESLTEDMYNELRKDSAPSALRGFAGFGCSFGGKWFRGFARGGFQSNGLPRDYAAESYRRVEKYAIGFAGREVLNEDYRELHYGSESVIYFDPPYENTEGYSTGGFDHRQFWDFCRGLGQEGHHVYVSEFSAPEDFQEIWSQERAVGLHQQGGAQMRKKDRLFSYKED